MHQTKDPALTSELEKEFASGKFFWVGSAEKGEGEGKFKVQGDLGSGYKDAPEEKTVKLIPVEFITPAGDPVNSPVDAETGASNADGANRFTFSTATQGGLTIKLNAKLLGPGSMSTADQAKFIFDIDTIGSSACGK